MKLIRAWLPAIGCGSSIECVDGVMSKVYHSITVCDIKADEDVYVKLNIPDYLTYNVVLERSQNTDNNELVVKDGKITFYCDKYHLPIKVTNKEVFNLIHEEYIGENVKISFNCYGKNKQ